MANVLFFHLPTAMRSYVAEPMHGMDVQAMRTVLRIVTNNYMPSADYAAMKAADAFLQGYDEHGGWLCVEFWTSSKEKARAATEYLNAALALL